MATATRVLLRGFHGTATITLDSERIITAKDEYGSSFEAVWMDADEMAEHQPCGMADCMCGDTLNMVEAKNDDWENGPYLVRVF